MRHPVFGIVLSCLLVLPTALAVGPAAAAVKGDPAIARLLDRLEYKYEVDEEGDYRLVFVMDGEKEGRSQLVYVRSSLEQYGTLRIREIWAPGYLSATDAFPAKVANRLLEATQESKAGAWAKQGRYAVFVIKVRGDAGSDELSDAIEAAVHSADEMEAELTPNEDRF